MSPCFDVLKSKDYDSLLRILQNPELSKEIDTESLEKLLPAKLLEPLEEQYLSKHQVSRASFSWVGDLSLLKFERQK